MLDGHSPHATVSNNKALTHLDHYLIYTTLTKRLPRFGGKSETSFGV